MSEQSKADLLRQLSISDEDTAHDALPWLAVSISILLGIVVGGGASWFYFNNLLADTTTGQAESQQVEMASGFSSTGTMSTAQEHNSNYPVSTSLNQASAQNRASNNVDTGFDSTNAILNASGYVTARLMATVSAEVMGRLKTVNVEEGMQVQKGQVLATIDDTLARLDWQLAEAQIGAIKQRLVSLDTELNEARRVLKRVRSLDQKNFSSDAQLTRAQADVDKLVSDKSALQAELNVTVLRAKRQQEVLADYTVTAPFSGVVTVKNAQAGEIVAPSSAGGGFTRTGICTIVDMDSLEIEVDVNEAYIGRVYDNQAIVAHLDAYEQWAIPASVIAVIPTADRSKATVRVRVAIHAKDSRILPQMGVKVSFFDHKYER